MANINVTIERFGLATSMRFKAAGRGATRGACSDVAWSRGVTPYNSDHENGKIQKQASGSTNLNVGEDHD